MGKRSYINSKDERVELTDEHIEAAIRIKLELQKASPSSRCSWHKHRKMMELEGYDDSDIVESYRQVIKYEQNKRGQLPKVQDYAQMVSEKTLDSIKQEIGEINHAKLTARQDFLKLNKVKRELNKDILLIEELGSRFDELDLNVIDYKPVFVDSLPIKTMIVGVSDLHYGAIVDVEGYLYNAEIAEKLMLGYADKIIQLAEVENVDKIEVVGMGDLVESAYMRHSQAYNVDMTFSEQINGAASLMIKFLSILSKYAKVSYAGINGNHDRMSSKNDTIFSDGAVNIINNYIKLFCELDTSRVEYIETDPYHHIKNVHGRSFLFVHGDITPIKKASVLAEQSSLYGIDFDALLAGHIHHFTMREVGYNKFVATFGSVKGSDEYSLKTIGSASSRSQGIVLVDENGQFDIRKISI